VIDCSTLLFLLLNGFVSLFPLRYWHSQGRELAWEGDCVETLVHGGGVPGGFEIPLYSSWWSSTSWGSASSWLQLALGAEAELSGRLGILIGY